QVKVIVARIVVVAAIVGLVAVVVTQGTFSLVQPTSVQAQESAGTIPPTVLPNPAPARGTNPNPARSPAAPAGGDAAAKDLKKPSCIDLSEFVRMKAADFDKAKGYP